MKFFVILVLACAASLIDSNKDLREINRMLKQRLRLITGDSRSISEEYIYNKEKLQVFIKQYKENTDMQMKFAMLEGIEYYCECIYEDFEVAGALEGITLEELGKVIKDLQVQLGKHRAYVVSKELADKYNALKKEVLEKDETLYKIQQENSLLLGKFANSAAEMQSYRGKLSQTEEKILKMEETLGDLKESHISHVENLKSTMQSTVIESISKEKANFKAIQESQDLVISSLQSQSEHLALKLEQISVENSGHNAKITILLNNISRLERDLSGKSSQLLVSENEYEKFRSTVEENTKKELENLRNMER